MAKLRNLVMRGASKQVGGMVTYQRAGETIARELAPEVKNPRTKKQMDQRTKLANLVNFYRANKGWLKRAFENKKAGVSDYNRLVSLNINNNLVALTKSEANAGVCIAAPYQVSLGSLPTLAIAFDSGDVKFVTDATTTASSITTVGQFSAALVADGWLRGDQFSIIVNVQVAGIGDNDNHLQAHAFEMIVDPESTELLADYFPGAFVSFGVDTIGHIEVFLLQNVPGAATAIHSRSVAGKTLVSSQYMVLSLDTLYEQYITDTQKENAIASYGESTEVFLDSDTAHKA